jgi:hypothetical protein
MKRINKGLLKRILAPMLGLLLMLTAAPISQSSIRGNNSKRAQPPQDGRRGRRGGRRSADGYPNWGGSFQLRQTALNEGANQGIKEGRNDRKRGEPEDYSDEKEYQKGTKSYSSRLGDRELYSRYFRLAFEHGYRDGWNGY